MPNSLPLPTEATLLLPLCTDSVTKHPVPTPKTFNFKLSPQHADVLQELGLAYVSMANNHVLDYGQQGLAETHRVCASVLFSDIQAQLPTLDDGNADLMHHSRRSYSMSSCMYQEKKLTRLQLAAQQSIDSARRGQQVAGMP